MIFFLLRHPPPFSEKQRRKLTEEAVRLHDQAQTLSDKREFNSALALIEKYIHLCDRLQSFDGAARACMDAGRLNAALEHWRHALSSFRRARWHYKLIRDTAGQASACAAMGRVLLEAQQFELAAKELASARKLLEKEDDENILKDVLHDLAVAYRNCERHAKELEAAVELIKLYEHSADNEMKADAYRTRGIGEANTGNKSEATKWLWNARDIYRTLHDEPGERQVLNDLALIYASLEQHDKAVPIVREIVSMARRKGDATSLCKAIVNLATVETDAGLYAEARKDFNEAEEVSGKLAPRDRQEANAQIKHHLAHWYYKQKQYESAENLAQQAADAFQSIGDYSNAMGCLSMVADAGREKRRPQ